jgi:hypothetical protein
LKGGGGTAVVVEVLFTGAWPEGALLVNIDISGWMFLEVVDCLPAGIPCLLGWACESCGLVGGEGGSPLGI